MPDISMCCSEDCPARKNCYRNPDSGTQPTPRRQSWMPYIWDEETGRCASYWPLNERKETGDE